MSWSYSGDPGNNDRDLVRWLVSDTDENEQLIANEEIDYLLTVHDAEGAAVKALEHLVTRFSRLADLRMGQLSISYSQRAETLQDRLEDLLDVIAVAPPWARLSVAEKEAVADIEDNVVTRVNLDIF